MFGLPGKLVSFKEITAGNINQTYRVELVENGGDPAEPAAGSYMMQRINSYAFHNADELMSNIERVTEFLRKKRPDRVNMHFYRTQDGAQKAYYFDGDGFWRVYDYIPGVTAGKNDGLQAVRSAGQAFGEFQRLLEDFPAEELYYTIPDFHNTRKRYEALLKTAEADSCGRASQCRAELAYLLSVRDEACTLTDLYDAGKLPLRVTHNDTKINNVLFDEKTGEPLVVIDLDTVMPGLAGNDFGDAIRSAANTVGEDAEDPGKAELDFDVFRAFANGFLSETAVTLTQPELETLAVSCFCLTAELAVRFLDDYIAGDKYFKVKNGISNLARARCQIALAKDIWQKKDEMQKVISALAEKYRG